MSSRARHRTSSTPPSLRRRVALRATVVLVALILTIVGVVQMRGLWHRLPHPSLEALDRDRASRAFADLQNHMDADARDGMLLAYASNQFTAALHEPDRLPEIRENVRRVAAAVRDSQFGRVQLAALAMLNFENAGVPVEQWWPQLRTYLTGLREARFSHHLLPYIAANARVYENLGLDPATAWRTAAAGSFAHGPLLEYVTARLETLAGTARAAGDAETADTVRAVHDRLLAEWIVEPGPPTLRMLAAQLLSNSLGKREGDDAVAGLAQLLRQWHRDMRGILKSLSPGVPLLNTSSQPEFAWAAYADRLRPFLTAALTLLAAALAIGVIALVGAFAWLPAPYGRHGALVGSVIGFGAVVVALAWPMLFPDAVEADLRRVTVPEIGWMWFPYISAAAAGVTVLAAGLIARRVTRRARWARLGRAATMVWFALAVVLLVMVSSVESDRKAYVRDNVTVLRQSWQNPPAGGPPPPVFDRLRSWAGLSE